MCWANTAGSGTFDVDDTTVDYTTVHSNDGGKPIFWDLTQIVKKWYAPGDESTKVAEIKLANLGNYNASNYGLITFFGYGQSYGPLFVVSYRDMAGIEPYYTYQTLGADRAGTGYISDATGNLTIVTPLVSYASGINPFSLSLVYNSLYQSNPSGPFHVSSNLGYGFIMGWNTKLSVLQKVAKVNLQNELQGSGTMTYLKYTDGDGTAHYFAKDHEKDNTDTYYFDEDGLGLKIKETSTGNYQMEDDKGNKSTFKNGFLSGTTDANGNQILVYFVNGSGTTPTNTPAVSGARPHHIAQKNNGEDEITVATFAYDYDSDQNVYKLRSVTDYASNLYQFTYSGNRFYRIFRTWADETEETKIVEFSYKDATSLIRRMRDFVTDYMVNFEFDDSNRVSKYYEHAGPTTGTGGEDGAAATITRVPGEKTVYTDWGNDRTEGTDDDIVTTCLFDYFGRTVNAYTATPANKLLGASNAIYTATSGTDKKNNRTLRSAGIGMASVQLLPNGGFEFTGNDLKWTMDTASGATVSAPADALPRTGHRSFKAAATASVSSVYGAHHLIGSLGVGKSYTVSAYVNTTGVTSFTGNGVYLKVTDAQGGVHQSEYLNYVTDPNIDGGWTRLDLSFQASHGGNHTVYLCLDGVIGDTYIDDLQVEYHDAPSNVNLIENGGFSFDFHGWKTQSGAALSSSDYVTNITAIQGKKALKITGNPTADKSLYQDVTVNQPGTQTYVLSGWAKANSVPDNVTENTDPAQDKIKQFGLRVMLTYSDNAKEYHYVPFNPDVKEWQFASLAIVPKKTNKTVSTIRIICAYEKNANTAYFDNLSLVREVAQTMTYDAEGKLSSVKSTGNADTSQTYSNGNLTQVNTHGQGVYNYSYDDKHNLSSAEDGLVKESYTRDAFGNVTDSVLTKADGTGPSINAHSTYTNKGNLVASVTDSRGKTTTYSYGSAINKMLGLASSVKNPNNTTTSTSYYNDGRVDHTGITNVASLTNSYNAKKLLTSISRGSYNSSTGTEDTQSYQFVYDLFGNTTQIKVGTQTLASYTYAPKDGLLTQMTYGNGATVSYAYDTLGRKTQTTTAGGDSYSYRYTGDGQLYEMTDTAGGLVYRYTYDTIGRLIGSSMRSGDLMALQTWHKYDTHNRLTKQSWAFPGASYSTNYSYDSNGRLHQLYHTLSTGTTYNTLAYDDLGRLSTGYTTKYRKEFQYAAGSGSNTTTTLVSQLSVISSSSGSFPTKTYSFSYDNLGNISQVTGPEGTTNYSYDVLSQLTQANRNNGAQVWDYSYDYFGNLKAQSYAENGVTQEALTYTYGDSNWKDKLTGLSVTRSGVTTSGSYTYDANGNPTSYFSPSDLSTWTMSWQNGRELATATNGTHTLSYDYDVNGLRTYKIVDGVRHDYFYASGKLLREEWTETENGVDKACSMDFFYDYAGNPYVVYISRGTAHQRFYYMTNLQGDVIGILNTSAELVAEYDYDPYGNLISFTGSSTGTELQQLIGQTNPLRYRGYYFDQETGFYYLQSRYYDPSLGRFINADVFTGTGTEFLSYNLFTYCSNNPSNSSDPLGLFDFGSLFEGASLLSIGITACIVAVTVVTAGACAPLAAVAAVTFGAGAVTAINGASEVTEAVTGYNPVRDIAYGGNTAGYEKDKKTASIIAQVGTALLSVASQFDICFVSGTLVKTEDGLKPIEQITQGEYVWAWDEDSDQVALRQVVETYVNETTELVHVFVAEEEIVSTRNHPFYSPVKGWTEACRLRAGDILVLVNGDYAVVEKVQHELLESPIKVYNLQVQDYHTYYVGSPGALVHNSCKTRPESPDKVSNSYINNNNIDAHRFKNKAAGIPQSQISRYDIYRDKANGGILWVGNKAQTVWKATKYYFKDLKEIWTK